jgi:hypothetical protein
MMSRFREIQEERARQARINQSRASGDSRQKVNQFVGGLRDRLGSMRENMGDRFSAFKNVVTNPNAGRQAFGSSPLQQAMAQRDAGMLTPQGAELLRGMEMDPDEMARQEGLMAQGRHGDYGIDRRANPTYTGATTNQVAYGPPEMIGNSPVTPSTSVAEGDVGAIDQRLLLDRMMKDPSKLNAEGVKSMQTTLNSLGFRDKDGNMLKVDGKMGPLTASAMDSYRGQLGQGVEDTGEALDPVSYTYRDARLADHTDSTRVSAPPKKWDPFNVVKSGTDNIQETIGNPANDPVMWGTDEFSSMTNPLQYDFESGEVFDPYEQPTSASRGSLVGTSGYKN